jgi:hypothetical protein
MSPAGLALSRLALAFFGTLLAFSACRRDVAPRSEPPMTQATRAPPAKGNPAGSAIGRPEPQAWFRVRGSHPDGTPLHTAPRSPGVTARLPNGTRVAVVETEADRHWVRVRVEDGTEGWLVERYLEADRQARADRANSPWSSREACESALQRGRPMRRPGVARIGTWNVQWFPDGSPGHGPPKSGGTDVGWLACALAWLDLDVLAVQEFKSNQRARERLGELAAKLGRLGSGQWAAELDDCDNQDGQHVGFLYDRARIGVRAWHTYATLNPSRIACQNQLRPGFGAHFRFPGGLDLHLITLHNKSGGDRRDFELRKTALGGLGAAEGEAGRLVSDPDLMLLGDFNTVGCRHC